MTDATDRAEQFIVRGDYVLRSGEHTTRYVDRELIADDPRNAARTINALLIELEEKAQDVLSLADKLAAIERMHPAGVSPPHELGTLPALCAGCDVFAPTDDDEEEEA